MRRDAIGSLLGILVFLGGIGLIVFVFQQAYELFSKPPSNAIGVAGAKAIDFNVVGNSLAVLVLRILLLIVMGVAGSLIANRGISMYTSSRAMVLKHESLEPPSA